MNVTTAACARDRGELDGQLQESCYRAAQPCRQMLVCRVQAAEWGYSLLSERRRRRCCCITQGLPLRCKQANFDAALIPTSKISGCSHANQPRQGSGAGATRREHPTAGRAGGHAGWARPPGWSCALPLMCRSAAIGMANTPSCHIPEGVLCIANAALDHAFP